MSGKGKYEHHQMYLFHFTDAVGESGKPKIKVLKEFFDSLYSARIHGLVPAAQDANSV